MSYGGHKSFLTMVLKALLGTLELNAMLRRFQLQDLI